MRLLLALALLLIFAPPARADEHLLTLYSPPIDSEPYVHRSTTVALKADGVQAPAVAGYVLGFKEQVLVDSKDPDAPPLPVTKMMVHHFLYFTEARADGGPGGCLGSQFLAGRGRSTRTGSSMPCRRRSSARGTASTTRRRTAAPPRGWSPRW